MSELMLYYRPTCPYCVKVLSHLKHVDIEVPMRDISSNADYVQELINTGGKKQVPCLIIDGKALYESDDIIDWFDNNKDNVKKK